MRQQVQSGNLRHSVQRQQVDTEGNASLVGHARAVRHQKFVSGQPHLA